MFWVFWVVGLLGVGLLGVRWLGVGVLGVRWLGFGCWVSGFLGYWVLSFINKYAYWRAAIFALCLLVEEAACPPSVFS